MKQHFDVIVVGGGHAGVEAAHAAHRTGAQVALITLSASAIGVMSCNPAIGGLGKGHLVREIDALGGVMGEAADAAGIQFRLLNRKKGPAVQGPRTQADRDVFQKDIQNRIAQAANVQVIEGEVSALELSGCVVTGVRLQDGSLIRAAQTVLTTGTFLRGVMHIGSKQVAGGRWKERPAKNLGVQLEVLGFKTGRLKTGTPPRLDHGSIAWDRLETQAADSDPTLFSFLSEAPALRQIACGITHTNQKTHDIITANIASSAMYGGKIEGVGPRYCPSIEDKVMRFSEKESHQIFLEPEGLNSNTIYPNGISTSLPEDVQADYLHSIFGLENAVILQPGYAIEYDFVDPVALDAELQCLDWPGLFLAGQINGTTGYEEAAGQGLVAGMNAALRALGKETVIFSRSQSYIGVMIDDLTTKGVTEPYRMFTSRAEFRLTLRADNADQRLTKIGREVGLVNDARWAAFSRKVEALTTARETLSKMTMSPNELARYDIKVKEDGKRRSILNVLSGYETTVSHLREHNSAIPKFAEAIERQVEIDAKYASYNERQLLDYQKLLNDDRLQIPADFSFVSLSGLSNELKEKLTRIRPRSIGQAQRIEGMTPSAALLVLIAVRKASDQLAS